MQTARTDWLRPFGFLPPFLAAGLLLLGLLQLAGFRPQERVWRAALDRAEWLALTNLGLSPFLYWWHRLPHEPFFAQAIGLLWITSLLFLFALNQVLQRLVAMVPDEALRAETQLFTTLNLRLILIMLGLVLFYLGLLFLPALPRAGLRAWLVLNQYWPWLVILLVFLPMSMTMAMLWKTKEVILASVFGPEA